MEWFVQGLRCRGVCGRRRGGWLLLAGLLVLGVLLAACSPRHDWRQVRVDQVTAMLPARPMASAREFQFEGQAVTFTISRSTVNQVVYAVGVARLPPAIGDDRSIRQRLARQTLASFYANLGNAPPAVLPEPGQRVHIRGDGEASFLRMDAMVWTTPELLIEGMVVGPQDRVAPEQLDEFFRELAPDQRPALQ